MGLVALTLCATGVLLTYKRQVERWLTEPEVVVPAGARPLTLEEIVTRAQNHVPLSNNMQVVVSNAPDAAVAVRQGRRGLALLNPYTGELLEPQRPWVRDAFHFVTRFHRWFAVGDEARPAAKFIVGVANLALLFLVASGLYLWLPPIWRRHAFRFRTLFVRKPRSSRMRDYNWHHVLGIWAAGPLVVLIVTGSVFSFNWTGDVIYSVLGVERPQRSGPEPAGGGRGRGRRGGQEPGSGQFPVVAPAGMLTLDALADVAAGHAPDWRELAIGLPRPGQSRVTVLIDRGNGGQPTLRETVTLNRATGETIESVPHERLPAAQRIRGTIRFLHTGEYFGFVGQTVAGLASLAGVLMVWTGIALAWRRLAQPLFARRRRGPGSRPEPDAWQGVKPATPVTGPEPLTNLEGK